MHIQKRTMLFIALVVLVAGSAMSAHAGIRSSAPEAKATLRDASGAVVGKVWLQEEGGKISVRAVVSGFAPGFHGFHIHAVGTCDPSIPAGQTSPFTSAGGHLSLVPGATHGMHSGDQPVLLVNADGTAWARFQSDRYTITDLFDADGSAFIVHAGSDNYANIPTRYLSSTPIVPGQAGPDAATLATGDAGSRVACGVIMPG